MTPNTAHSTDRLPYPLYAIVAGLVLWLVIASWGFMGPATPKCRSPS